MTDYDVLAKYIGGVFEISFQALVVVEDSTFDSNAAVYRGSVFDMVFSKITIRNISVINGGSVATGGFGYLTLSMVLVSDSTFHDCSAVTGGVFALGLGANVTSTGNSYIRNDVRFFWEFNILICLCNFNA